MSCTTSGRGSLRENFQSDDMQDPRKIGIGDRTVKMLKVRNVGDAKEVTYATSTKI